MSYAFSPDGSGTTARKERNSKLETGIILLPHFFPLYFSTVTVLENFSLGLTEFAQSSSGGCPPAPRSSRGFSPATTPPSPGLPLHGQEGDWEAGAGEGLPHVMVLSDDGLVWR